MFSNIILQLIVFLLPTQLGLHFWPDFSRVAGIKIDYLSPTLYLTDLFILSYILTSIRKVLGWIHLHTKSVSVFALLVILNTLFAISPLNTLLWWIRSIVYISLFLAFRLNKVSWQQIKAPLIYSTILVVFIEVIQTTLQSSIGGILYWLGERSYSASTPGLARLNLSGLNFVRAPSIFSHPNSLSGYLLVVYYLLHINKSPLWQKLAVFTGLLLTFSKASLLAFVLVISLYINSSLLIATFMIFSLLQVFLPYLPNSLQFISDRLFLLSPVKSLITTRPILGSGLGGFIPSLVNYLPGSFLLPEKLQPVHNLPLLICAEGGILGVWLLFTFIKVNLNKLLKPQVLGLIALVVITGAFDHYWWTLPQNKLILLLAVSILL